MYFIMNMKTKISILLLTIILLLCSCEMFDFSTHQDGWFDGYIKSEVNGQYLLEGEAKPGGALFPDVKHIKVWIDSRSTDIIRDYHPVGSFISFYFDIIDTSVEGADALIAIVTMD